MKIKNLCLPVNNYLVGEIAPRKLLKRIERGHPKVVLDEAGAAQVHRLTSRIQWRRLPRHQAPASITLGPVLRVVAADMPMALRVVVVRAASHKLRAQHRLISHKRIVMGIVRAFALGLHIDLDDVVVAEPVTVHSHVAASHENVLVVRGVQILSVKESAVLRGLACSW